MTQDEYNSPRDLIRRGLINIAEGLMAEADGEADPLEIATYQSMLNEIQLAALTLERDDPKGSMIWLGWVGENALDEDDELACTCPDCTKEKAEAAN